MDTGVGYVCVTQARLHTGVGVTRVCVCMDVCDMGVCVLRYHHEGHTAQTDLVASPRLRPTGRRWEVTVEKLFSRAAWACEQTAGRPLWPWGQPPEGGSWVWRGEQAPLLPAPLSPALLGVPLGPVHLHWCCMGSIPDARPQLRSSSSLLACCRALPGALRKACMHLWDLGRKSSYQALSWVYEYV